MVTPPSYVPAPVEPAASRLWLHAVLFVSTFVTLSLTGGFFWAGVMPTDGSGFLTLRFLPQSAAAVSPVEANQPVVVGHSNGNVFVRDCWEGRTVLAAQGGSGPLHGPGHLHGDLNSFILFVALI